MSVTPILTRSLRYGALVALAVAVVAGVVGLFVSGVPGLLGAVAGSVLAAVFLGLTAASMLLASRAAKGDGASPVYFGVVLGMLAVKFVVFLVLMLWLRGQDWLDLRVFAGAVIAAVLGSLIADMVAFARARVPYVSDVRLPGEEGPEP